MVAGRHKSKSLRKVSVKTPGGRTTVHYRKRKPAKAKCGMCKAVLQGVPQDKPSKISNMAKSKKRPERPHGGTLCVRCSRKKIIESARV